MLGTVKDAMSKADNFYKGRSPKAIAARLIALRSVLGLRQAQFGYSVGIKRSIYNQIENGTAMLTLDRANIVCDTHNVTLDWLYRGDASSLRKSLFKAVKKAYKTQQKIESKL